MNDVIRLARELVALDSRSSLSNLAVADRIEAELVGFEIERLDFIDPAGVAKRALVAHRGPMMPGAAFSAHMDTVPATGWTTDPWSPVVADGRLTGLGACDMKGPLAASIVAAKAAPAGLPITLLYTFDEETTKAGAHLIAEQSALARRAAPKGIVVVEPSSMRCVRGHRVHVQFTATASGVQAHSSTGKGLNANLALIRFLHAILPVHERLRNDPSWQDTAYDPPFSDFNITIDNHGTAANVTVAKATARIKFRYSRKVDPMPIVTAVRDAAREFGVALEEAWESSPPELAEDHPLVAAAVALTGVAPITAPYGTDASELQAIAPCIVLGPGDVSEAHKPGESIPVAELEAAPAKLLALAEKVAAL